MKISTKTVCIAAGIVFTVSGAAFSEKIMGLGVEPAETQRFTGPPMKPPPASTNSNRTLPEEVFS